jgi:hypothetical protein
MSRTNRAGKTAAARDTIRHAVAQAGPLAASTTAAVRHRVIRSRAWAAPQVERTGEFMQEVAAPKLSAVLSSAARKIDPVQPRRRRWTRRAGLAGLIAAVSATVAVLRKKGKPAASKTAEETKEDGADEAQSPQLVPVPEPSPASKASARTEGTAIEPS